MYEQTNHYQRIAKKYERHYPNKRILYSIMLLLFSITLIIPLTIIWPQFFSSQIFNSKLIYHIMIDIEDYYTCSNDYQKFVVNEPNEEYNLLSIYVFNITNPNDVLQRGYKPNVVETGPYAYVKNVYKYDIEFDAVNSLTISYKEYIILSNVIDQSTCERVYYRMDRAYVTLGSDPCSNNKCSCQDHNTTVITVNPLFLKLLYDESPFSIISYYSSNIFGTIKSYIENDVVNALKSFLVATSYSEIYIFRLHYQVLPILQTSLSNLTSSPYNYNLTTIVKQLESYDSSYKYPSQCGLYIYSINYCILYDFSFIYQRNKDNYLSKNLTKAIYPSLYPIFNSSNQISILNEFNGLSNWLAIVYYLGYVDLGFNGGYSTIYGDSYSELYNNFTYQLTKLSFGSNFTDSHLIGSQIAINSVAEFLGTNIITKEFDNLKSLVFDEFNTLAHAVPCNPLGYLCYWSWGIVRELASNITSDKTTNRGVMFGGYNHSLSYNMISSLIDQNTKIESNLNNIYYDNNQAAWYNTYLFCQKYQPAMNYTASDSQCADTNISYTYEDALLYQPSGLWGIENGDISALNQSYLTLSYLNQSYDTRYQYYSFACNLTYLLFDIYMNDNNYHDVYVASYLNKNKDARLNYSFEISYDSANISNSYVNNDQFILMGYSQWGGGFITEALVGVKAIYQVKRDAMWYFGDYEYYSDLIEYSSWAITTGFPNAYITDVFDAQTLLHALSDSSENGVAFRKHISYTSTTYVGDGVNFIRGVGNIGDYTYTLEANTANFSCSSLYHSKACEVLNKFMTSSADQCNVVQSLYTNCLQLGYKGNKWTTNCDRFETSQTSPLTGVQCDSTSVYGHDHPYTKSKGNVMNSMMYSLTLDLQLLNGLWCYSSTYCNYRWGGMFQHSTVKQLLFEGYTDPSVLQYYNLKYSKYLSYSCLNKSISSQDSCKSNSLVDKGQLLCDDLGIQLTVKNYYNQTTTIVKSFKYLSEETTLDEYFSPFYIITKSGDLLFPYSYNESIRSYALNIIKELDINITNNYMNIYNRGLLDLFFYDDNTTNQSSTTSYTNATANYIIVNNPIWAVYPAWNHRDVTFHKYMSCLKRVYSGVVDLFNNCTDMLYTGRDDYSKILQLKSTHGNDSIDMFPNERYAQSFNVTGSMFNINNYQYTSYQWDGFNNYPYSYRGRSKGIFVKKLTNPVIFDKTHSYKLVLSQTELLYDFEKNLVISFPLSNSFKSINQSSGISLSLRRLTEDSDTWNYLRVLGVPKDSFGMNYTIPYGMATIERLSGLPLYIGTPHCYGNELWGGSEYSMVSGYSPDQYSQRTYIDYDPVTGFAMRNAIRLQLQIRVEASAIFPNAFQSQQRCVPPTKQYASSTGYGCFAYIPLLWSEDAVMEDESSFLRLNHNYYTRPNREYKLTVIGVVIGIVFGMIGLILLISEIYFRRKFYNRVYVD